jgi:serine/threonine-protein kinase
MIHDGAENVHQLMVKAATSQARSLASASPDVAPSLAAIVDRALAFDKHARWSGAAEMRDALARALPGEAPSAACLAELLEALDLGSAETEVFDQASFAEVSGRAMTLAKPPQTRPGSGDHRATAQDAAGAWSQAPPAPSEAHRSLAASVSEPRAGVVAQAEVPPRSRVGGVVAGVAAGIVLTAVAVFAASRLSAGRPSPASSPIAATAAPVDRAPPSTAASDVALEPAPAPPPTASASAAAPKASAIAPAVKPVAPAATPTCKLVFDGYDANFQPKYRQKCQ